MRALTALPSARLSVCLALLALATGCKRESEADRVGDVVALVNGEALSREDFARELRRELSGGELPDPTQEQLEPLRRALLDSHIERMLILQEARKLEVVVADEDVDRQLLRMAAQFPADRFQDALGQSALTQAEFKRRTRERLTIEKLFATRVYPRVAVTEAELRDAFTERAAEFETQEQVRMLQIVVRELDEATRLRGQLRAGKATFGELARRFSLSADAKVGGDLGFFPKGRMPAVFEEWAWKLPLNQVSDVVESEYGFHLFMVLERRAAARPDFAQARVALEKRLVSERQQAAERAWVEALKGRAQVTISEATLRSIQVRATRADGGAE